MLLNIINSLSPSRFKLLEVSMNFIIRALVGKIERRQKISVEKESCIRKYAGNFYRNLIYLRKILQPTFL